MSKRISNIIQALKGPNARFEILFRLRAPFFRKTPVYIISFPKTGRTWLRSLIGRYIVQKNGLNDEYIMDTPNLTMTSGLNPTLFTHDRSSVFGVPYYQMKKDRSGYSKSKVIFMVRDPMDVIVSYYFHIVKRWRQYEATISEFIRSDLYPMQKMLTFYNIWYDHSDIPKDFLLVRYEELHSDPKNVLYIVLKFLGEEDPDDTLVEESVAFSSFNNLQKLEKNEEFFKSKPAGANEKDINTLHFRSGKIGGYRNTLNEEDIAYLREIINEIGDPYY